MHKGLDNTCWVERESILAMGYSKIVFKKDEQEAAAAGLLSKPLTQPGVEKALKDFGLDTEAASYSPIGSLSHGQKVKVVICASCWQNPHVLILDKPTNYLDRDGLGALVLAINDYKGGVLIISHNKEFCDSVATEKWIMKGGYLRIEGESVEKEEDKEAGKAGEKEDVYDASGNKIDVKLDQFMDAKTIKKKIKDLEKKLKDGKKKKTLTDEEMWELQDQLTDLADKLAKKAEEK